MSAPMNSLPQRGRVGEREIVAAFSDGTILPLPNPLPLGEGAFAEVFHD